MNTCLSCEKTHPFQSSWISTTSYPAFSRLRTEAGRVPSSISLKEDVLGVDFKASKFLEDFVCLSSSKVSLTSAASSMKSWLSESTSWRKSIFPAKRKSSNEEVAPFFGELGYVQWSINKNQPFKFLIFAYLATQNYWIPNIPVKSNWNVIKRLIRSGDEFQTSKILTRPEDEFRILRTMTISWKLHTKWIPCQVAKR